MKKIISVAFLLLYSLNFYSALDPNSGHLLKIAAQAGNREEVLSIVTDIRLRINALDLGDAFIAAAQNGHTPTVQVFMNHPIFRRIGNVSLGIALHEAAQNGHRDIVTTFLNNQRFPVGSVLSNVSRRGCTDIVEMFTSHPNFRNLSEDQLYFSLHEAAESGHTNIVQMLLNAVDFKTALIDAPLIGAACGGRTDIVQMIITHPKFREISNDDLAFALIQAACNGHTNIVQMLLQDQSCTKISDSDLHEVLRLANQNRNKACAHWLKAYIDLKAEVSSVETTP